MSTQRTRIASYITTVPGIHFNGLVRELDLAPGQVQYHLQVLRGRDEVVEQRLYGKTHYYPPGYDDRERRLFALARRETARDILTYLAEHGSARPVMVANTLDIARSMLEWQLDRLIEQDVIEKNHNSHNRVRLVLTDPQEVAQLIGDLDPSFAERMADRFVRLTDRLLDDGVETNE